MPGNYVFPGGTVDFDDTDHDFWQEYVDMDAGQVTDHLGGSLSNEDAMAHGIAAIREMFEEACLLLAHCNKRGANDLEQLREQQSKGGLRHAWLRELVLSGGCTLTFSGLARWSHWITPEVRSKRYDTRFFIAFMREGQECRPDNRETTHGVWLTPEKALQGNLEGTVPLSPPAVVTLQELLSYPGVAALKNEIKIRPWGEARIPRLLRMNEEALLLLPWDPHYERPEIEVDTRGPEKRNTPVGKSFSRLRYSGGIWRPVWAGRQ